MSKIQVQGVHHITLAGADRQTSIEFWEGLLGMPFIFDQPNLDDPDEGHLYFDPGDDRLITVLANEGRKPERRAASGWRETTTTSRKSNLPMQSGFWWNVVSKRCRKAALRPIPIGAGESGLAKRAGAALV